MKLAVSEIQALRDMADAILKVDGDRDHMNRSDLTVVQTVLVARALQVCADLFDRAELEVAA